MADRGLLFKPDMALAAHEGRKTVTRRIGERFRKWVVGDTLIVKETHWRWGWFDGEGQHKRFKSSPKTLAPMGEFVFAEPSCWKAKRSEDLGYHKRPSIFMPWKYARTRGRITDIREERLQDITEEDAIAEGVLTSMEYPFENGELPCPVCDGAGVHGAFGENYGLVEVDCDACDTIVKRFSILWDSINGERYPWANNDLVWRIQWELLT